jgi:hypothetical protein
MVALLYELMRDAVVPGTLERMVQMMEDVKLRHINEGRGDESVDPPIVWDLTNGHLAEYAEELVVRLDRLHW